MTDSETSTRSKVARLISEYDLSGVGDDLVKRWTRSEDRYGLRQLADFFNRQLLRSALTAAGDEPLDGEVENTYRLLTDDDVTSGVRTQARNRLARNGVDVEKLEGDFVSRQAIHTYLDGYREVEPPEDTATPADQRDRRREAIQRLTQRLVAVSERALRDLTEAGHLTLGQFNVLVTVSVYCSDCGTQRPITELLADGSCECAD